MTWVAEYLPCIREPIKTHLHDLEPPDPWDRCAFRCENIGNTIHLIVSDFMACVYTTKSSVRRAKVSQNVLQCNMTLKQDPGIENAVIKF